jgi:hypothetical protein
MTTKVSPRRGWWDCPFSGSACCFPPLPPSTATTAPMRSMEKIAQRRTNRVWRNSSSTARDHKSVMSRKVLLCPRHFCLIIISSGLAHSVRYAIYVTTRGNSSFATGFLDLVSGICIFFFCRTFASASSSSWSIFGQHSMAICFGSNLNNPMWLNEPPCGGPGTPYRCCPPSREKG